MHLPVVNNYMYFTHHKKNPCTMYTREKQQPKYLGSFHEDTKISNKTIFYLFLHVSSIQIRY